MPPYGSPAAQILHFAALRSRMTLRAGGVLAFPSGEGGPLAVDEENPHCAVQTGFSSSVTLRVEAVSAA